MRGTLPYKQSTFTQEMDNTQIILARVEYLIDVINNLEERLNMTNVTYYENLPPDATVGKDYVAYRFNCTEAAVVRGRFDTDQIPRIRNKPIAFTKREVDAVQKNLSRSPAEKAAEIRRKVTAPKKRAKN